MDSDSFNDMLNPYGVNTPPSPISDKVIAIYQGDPLTIVREVYNFDGQPARPDNCELIFTIVDKRFEQKPLFRGDWTKYITQSDTFARIKIDVPSKDTKYFRRGSLLYSLTMYDKLMSKRKLIEEGNILVEYSADAPHPAVPYTAGNGPEIPVR